MLGMASSVVHIVLASSVKYAETKHSEILKDRTLTPIRLLVWIGRSRCGRRYSALLAKK
jgi:hypothetical protein